jgi:hypothetical protein
MGPYSHIVIAQRLEKTVQPDDLQEYYWGALAPDIRYLVDGMPRSATHIPVEEIAEYMVSYPERKPFIQGYLVHCLSDSLNIPGIIHRKFPFRVQNEKLSAQQCSVIFEFYNIERVAPDHKILSGTDNSILKELGIGGAYAAKFAQAVKRYIGAPSFDASVVLYQDLGLAGDARIEKYRAAVERFQRDWLWKKMILIGLGVGSINREITNLVKEALQSEVMLSARKPTDEFTV